MVRRNSIDNFILLSNFDPPLSIPLSLRVIDSLLNCLNLTTWALHYLFSGKFGNFLVNLVEKL